VCEATGLGVLDFAGDDAPAFLHGQLSSDVNGLAPGRSQVSSYNSPKGRTLATLRLWRSPDTALPPRFGAFVAADLAAPIARRLGLFVLRAKLRIADVSAGSALFGVGGPRAAEAIAAACGVRPEPDGAAAAPGGVAMIIGLGDGRFVIVADRAEAAAFRARSGSGMPVVDGAVWRWLGVRAGVPLVTAATSERFVPQMLNLELLDGISFNKGCYPGQEVIARIHNLGSVKRRMRHYAALLHHVPPPGSAIFRDGDAEPVGEVVRAAPAQTGVELLAVVEHDAAQGQLFIGADEHAELIELPLPYDVPRA
jgi:folate-binding protein YgfZ